jgi:hypothetical protein
MENTFKNKKPQKRFSLFTFIEDNLKVFALFDNGVPVKYLPYVLYVICIAVFYIWNSHNAERNVRRIGKLQKEVDELRADYTTLQASYMFASKQSEVAKRVNKLGIYESSEPPYKIVVEESEY